MGMHPAAQVSYGIAVPDMEGWPGVGELPWWTEAADEEHGDHERASREYLKQSGIEGVHIDSYGHLGYGECGIYIRTAQVQVYAYDVQELSREFLDIDPGDAPKLKTAFRLLFPDTDHAEPAWIVTLIYG